MTSTIKPSAPEAEEKQSLPGERFLKDTSKHAKTVVHRNNMERTAHDKVRRHLEREHLSKQTTIAREEKEMKQTLMRLQDELGAYSHLSSSQDDLAMEDITDATSILAEEDALFGSGDDGSDHVVNPYPVTILAAQKHPSPAPSRPSSEVRTRQNISVEFEDLDLHSSGKILPPLSTRRPLSGQFSHSSLVRSDSLSSVKTTNSNHNNHKDKAGDRELWAGDPEAIQSVRRPRRTLAQQRLDNLLHRGESGDTTAAKATIQHWRNLKRSQSLKERKPALSPSASDVFSRSNSLKENLRKRGGGSVNAVNSVTETLTGLDLHERKGRRGLGRSSLRSSRESSTISLRDFSTSPETKSGVWGWVASGSSPETGSPTSSVCYLDEAPHSRILHRRRKMMMQGIKCQSVDIPRGGNLPPIASPTDGALHLSGSPKNLYNSLPPSPSVPGPRTPSPFASGRIQEGSPRELDMSLQRKGSAKNKSPLNTGLE